MNLTKRTNYRVEVEAMPQTWLMRPDRDTKTDEQYNTEKLADEIKRHCDVRSVYVEYDVVCATCGEIWETPPECCESAMNEYEKEHPGVYEVDQTR